MKVIFLDRDGVINEYPGDRNYITNHKEFKFIAGSIQGIKKLKDKGFKLFVISNQAGISKGLYSEKELSQITKKMVDGLKKHKVQLDGIFYCRHREEDSCACRKPNTGLMHEAVKGLDKPVTVSFFIGDSFRDMNAAKKFGAKPVLVLSGKEKIANRSSWDFEPDYIFDNLLIASYYICSHYG